MTRIHPTAIVHPQAVIGEGTTVGPFSIINEGARIGKNCDIQENVIVRGHTEIGDECKIFPFSVVGAEPQHLGYKGEPTRVEIGTGVTLRESVTIHRGTVGGGGVTKVGDGCYIMAYSHVAHDCIVGKNVIIANTVQLAGHVVIKDNAVLGGQSAVVQHCRVGEFCYIGGGSIIRKDLPPFTVGKGNPFEVQGINAVGLSRKGYSDETLGQLRTLYKIFFLQKLNVNEAVEKIIAKVGETPEVKLFMQFLKDSKMGFVR